MERTTKAAPRMHFTKASVAAVPVPPKGGRAYAYDTKMNGLALAVTPTGCRTFYRSGRIDGRYVRVTIGRFPACTVEQARRQVQTLDGEIGAGVNPQERKRAARAELTFRAVFAEYLADYAKPKKKSWRQDVQQYERYLTPLALHRVSAITKVEVRKLHASIGRKHGRHAANRALALVHTVFAKFTEVVPNPASGIERFKEESRERSLQPAEVGSFFAAVDAEPSPVWRDFFELLLWTGARRANVQAMAWADLDLDDPQGAVWWVPAGQSKSGKALGVVLSGRAVDVLRRRRADAGTSGFVFPGVGRTGHVAEPKKAWAALLARAGIQNLRIHDLRRTLGSWQADAGASLAIIGRSLGHASGSSATATYARVSDAPVRASVEAATAALLAAGAPVARDVDIDVEVVDVTAAPLALLAAGG